MKTLRTLATTFAFLALSLASAQVFAAYPIDGYLNMQDAASTSAERIHHFHDFMIWIISAISVFVLILLLWVMIRYNKRANPTPSSTSHNVLIEIIWTVVPVVILIVISIQSLPLLYYTDRAESPDMTLKITGYQWYWGYEYPDNGDISFLSNMVADADIDASAGQIRNLSTDNPVVLPVGKNISLQTTAADVLHAWTIPAFGVKKDSVPGRLNETWVHITKPGVYYGQCSELCGKNHAFMPIEVHAVSPEQFEEWAALAATDLDAATSFVKSITVSATETAEANQ
ncbi:MAG: cytochrome c oxidase subunit II [Alphaproteobacteria bacterium]|nr:cytochrome c oxidase subunit II [Alphaproteobacteria bacterium]MCD8520123.1 cytochrome c oxidase subunit II [Alphaproteobacteria bacterium]MCD8525941.1 cytochrome c oxidase subunit II [Alphaproteobacteria bacterium]MCD8571088.1 cytochrome c oxidase subunit II [Alphaproteobacteria bacterium]